MVNSYSALRFTVVLDSVALRWIKKAVSRWMMPQVSSQMFLAANDFETM
jgi:hypothetical protein